MSRPTYCSGGGPIAVAAGELGALGPGGSRGRARPAGSTAANPPAGGRARASLGRQGQARQTAAVPPWGGAWVAHYDDGRGEVARETMGEREEVAAALEEAARAIRGAGDGEAVGHYERVGRALTSLAESRKKATKAAELAEGNIRTALGNLRPRPPRGPRFRAGASGGGAA